MATTLAEQRTAGGGQRTGQRIPGKPLGSFLIGHHLRQPSLFNRKERADFGAAGTDDAHDSGYHQQPELMGQRKKQTRTHHQQGPEHQRPPPPKAIGSGCQPERDRQITGQRQREEQTNLRLRQPDLSQIERQHHGQTAVGDQPQAAGGEEQEDVTAMGRRANRR
jgi:hypothetical protein